MNYIVAGSKSWNKKVFDEVVSSYEGKWIYVDTEKGLIEKAKLYNPRYIFFLHWSWIVPNEIVEYYECVCFHMADVPYGKGGSPLQNLIARGHKETKLTALRMVEQLDAGPVYLKEDLSLYGSSAEEIYIRSSYLSAKMIKKIIENDIMPKSQTGKELLFKRRKYEESEISTLHDLESLFDFIRMLDAEGYPKAFLLYEKFKLEFSRVAIYNGKLLADVKITRKGEKE
ncbi:MAG: methionyl-tRNA formyltransferase [Deltaproteobacteria bacterium]|nr:methionyl-tRNA formyltransferase [Deltaproteobacteria bacterium]